MFAFNGVRERGVKTKHLLLRYLRSPLRRAIYRTNKQMIQEPVIDEIRQFVLREEFQK